MMSLLLTSLLSLHFLQISAAKTHCTPSSCGIIRNISSPFHLKSDPKHCGDRRFELECENNITSLYIDSHQFYVKAINYSTDDPVIRLVDASMNAYDTCSFPNSSTYHINFHHDYYLEDNFYVSLMRCLHRLDNSSLFTDVTHCGNFSSGFNYIKVGHLNASEVKLMCKVEVIALTSWRGFKDKNNVSLLEIHRSLLYGFEVQVCSRCESYSNVGDILIIIVGFLSFVVTPATTIIFIGFTFALGFRFYPFTVAPGAGLFYLLQLIVATNLALRFIFWPFIMWFLIYKFRRRHLSVFDAIESFLQSDDNSLMPIRYSYRNIKQITRNFHDKIGEGGFGRVYRGKLRSGHDVAVKLLGKSGANVQDFMNEIATIGRIHHVNVVKLVGYCAQGSKRALVYDFMPNGSLEKYILKSENRDSLNWDLKLEIAIGVARGIEYLHRGCDVQILHFDIKPHNILLDDKFIPKLSDFGLAKSCPTDKTSVTMTMARGTIGYVAPELISRSIGVVSNKADVYSFGMLLMEMVNFNKDLIGYSGDSNLCFPYWIYDYCSKDHYTGMTNDIEEDDRTGILVRKMAMVALWCIQMSPNDRPSMNKVLEMLEGDVEHLPVPNYPLQTAHTPLNRREIESSCSSDSLPLVSQDVSSCVHITVQE